MTHRRTPTALRLHVAAAAFMLCAAGAVTSWVSIQAATSGGGTGFAADSADDASLVVAPGAATPSAGGAPDGSSLAAAPGVTPPGVGSPAAALFGTLRSLEGEWTGTSTRGWSETTSFRTIAGGSVVVQTSFDAHPGETMMTMYHLDGSRLLLTHYCVAKNQPRLVATEIAGDGKTATFAFLDVTGIPSRDAGHMDKAAFRFESADRFTSRWTWYQNGTERWMEEIVYERKR